MGKIILEMLVSPFGQVGVGDVTANCGAWGETLRCKEVGRMRVLGVMMSNTGSTDDSMKEALNAAQRWLYADLDKWRNLKGHVAKLKTWERFEGSPQKCLKTFTLQSSFNTAEAHGLISSQAHRKHKAFWS